MCVLSIFSRVYSETNGIKSLLHNPWAEKLVHKILLLDRPRMNILPLYRFKLHSIHFLVSLNCYIVILQIPAYVSGRFISFIWANKWVYYSFFGLQTIKRIIKISIYVSCIALSKIIHYYWSIEDSPWVRVEQLPIQWDRNLQSALIADISLNERYTPMSRSKMAKLALNLFI